MSIFFPLQLLADWLTYRVFHIASDTLLASAINFFIFDTIKIFILLTAIIFVVSIIRSYLPPEKIRFVLARKNPYVGNIIASLLGIITPFCSCSAIPLFLGFIQAGVPLGVTFSFLVASPMINEVALVLLLGMFGWKIAAIYIISGLVIAIVSGIVIEKMKVEHLVEPFVYQHSVANDVDLPNMSDKLRVAYAARYTWGIIKKVWPYVLIGIGVGAWIHGYVPADFLVQYAGSDKWYAVPLASALTEKGVAMGTTLAFMMSVTALSLPECMILKKVMKTKLILIFISVVGVGIIFSGYVFNAILD
jgi:hypothetical protein